MEATTTQQPAAPRVHIFAPPSLSRSLRKSHCPVCEKTRYFIVYTYEWFGATEICLGCGDHWNDGELSPRPFMRAWRKASKADAKQRWRHQSQRIKGSN